MSPRGLILFFFAWLAMAPIASAWFLLGAANLLFSPSCPDDLPYPDCRCFIPDRRRGTAIVCDLQHGTDFYAIIDRIYDHGGLIDHLLINGCPKPIGELGELPKLKVYHLAITNCGIKSIKPGAFSKSAFWLNRLELDYNELEQLDFGLAKLDQLAWLKVRHNRLSTIPSKTFAFNPLLFNVNLANNRIWWIAGDAFDKATSPLQTLNLRGNRLNALPSDLIQKKTPDDFKQLTGLDLSSNNLQGVVNAELLKGYTNLAVLRLWNNQLTNVTLPTDLKSLRVLDISHCRIADIDHLPIEELTSLDYLFAQNNEIKSPDLAGMKKRLGGQRFLYANLSRNAIRTVSSELLHELCPSNLIVNLESNWLAGGEFDHCNIWRVSTIWSRNLHNSIQLHNDAPIPVKCSDPMLGCSRLVPVLDDVKDLHYKFTPQNWTHIPADFTDA